MLILAFSHPPLCIPVARATLVQIFARVTFFTRKHPLLYLLGRGTDLYFVQANLPEQIQLALPAWSRASPFCCGKFSTTESAGLRTCRSFASRSRDRPFIASGKFARSDFPGAVSYLLGRGHRPLYLPVNLPEGQSQNFALCQQVLFAGNPNGFTCLVAGPTE